jgi:hypothetical protein
VAGVAEQLLGVRHREGEGGIPFARGCRRRCWRWRAAPPSGSRPRPSRPPRAQ